MRFHAEHRFVAPVDAVIAGLLDPAFHRGLQLPDVRLLDVDQHSGGGESLLRLRYAFVGHLDPMATRLLGGRQLIWRQELRLDPTSHDGRMSFEAEADPQRLHGAADITLRPAEGGGTVRQIDGELVVKAPLIGGAAERRIVPGLLRRLDVEAHALDDRLGQAR